MELSSENIIFNKMHYCPEYDWLIWKVRNLYKLRVVMKVDLPHKAQNQFTEPKFTEKGN